MQKTDTAIINTSQQEYLVIVVRIRYKNIWDYKKYYNNTNMNIKGKYETLTVYNLIKDCLTSILDFIFGWVSSFDGFLGV